MGVNNLPRVVAWQCASRESNPVPLDLESNMLSTISPITNKNHKVDADGAMTQWLRN